MRFPGAVAAMTTLVLVAGCDTQGVDVTPPSRPDGVYSVTGDRQVSLGWHGNDEQDLAGYRVYRSASLNGAYGLLATVYVNAYVDAAVTNGQSYYYRVTAFDRAGNESDPSQSARDTPRPEGTAVLYSARGADANRSGFDFSTESRAPWDCACADVYLDTPGSAVVLVTGWKTDIQDAGYAPSAEGLSRIDWAPDDGWSPTGSAEVIANHAYLVWTSDNHYASLYVESVDPSHAAATFRWAYQLDAGNPELAPPASGAHPVRRVHP